MNRKLRSIFVATLSLLGYSELSSQTVYHFTTASATGADGPTQAMVNTAYASTNLAGLVTVGTGASAGIQRWTVPSSGKYVITAYGAQGGGANGGLGASMTGEFQLIGGTVLNIIVGQQGITEPGQPNSVGGGGGSFVVKNPATAVGDILVIAGGGGGAPSTTYPTCHANSTTSGNAGHVDSGVSNPDGAGGTGGNGGHKSVSVCSLDRGAGGGGFLTDGQSVCQSAGVANGGAAFVNGGRGGTHNSTGAEGGFGGGGAVWSTGFRGAGGGGGYSGGGAGQINSSTIPDLSGGGAGSFNAGNNQVNIAGTNSGDGEVFITLLPSAPNDAGISSIVSPTSNCVGTYPVTATINNFGTNQITGVTVNWSINGTPMAPYVHSTLLDTAGGIGPNSATVNLGSISLAGGTSYDIKAWTLQPNGTNDTVNDNDTILKTVNGYAYPIINLGGNFSICPEDSATLNGGTGHDSLLWSNTATTQSITVNTPGQYKVTVYENGCASSDSIMLSHFPGAPAVDLGPDTMICWNDSLVLDATASGVTYKWQNSTTAATQTVSAAGTYWVELEDANTCNSSDTIEITLHTMPTISMFVAPGNVVCYGVPVTFTANGHSQGSIMYQWVLNGVNNGPPTATNTFNPTTLVTGDSVYVELISDLCVSGTAAYPSNVVHMTVNPEPLQIGGKDMVRENDIETYVVAISSTSNYNWTATNGTILGPANTNAVTVQWGAGPATGTITCAETDNHNCTYPNEMDVEITSTIGIKESVGAVNMGYAYPNPARTSYTIPLEAQANVKVSLNMYDLTGKMVKAIYNGELSGTQNITVDVDDLENGMYFYKLITSDGYKSIRKISVQR